MAQSVKSARGWRFLPGRLEQLAAETGCTVAQIRHLPDIASDAACAYQHAAVGRWHVDARDMHDRNECCGLWLADVSRLVAELYRFAITHGFTGAGTCHLENGSRIVGIPCYWIEMPGELPR